MSTCAASAQNILYTFDKDQLFSPLCCFFLFLGVAIPIFTIKSIKRYEEELLSVERPLQIRAWNLVVHAANQAYEPPECAYV